MLTIYQPPAIEQQRIAERRSSDYKDRTPPPRLMLAGEPRTTADLMGVLGDALSAQRDAAIERAIQLASSIRQDIGAEQLRREAW